MWQSPPLLEKNAQRQDHGGARRKRNDSADRRQVKKGHRFARGVIDVAQWLSRDQLFDYFERAVNVLVTRRIRDSDVPLAELAER
jgi:hypothetical protein